MNEIYEKPSSIPFPAPFLTKSVASLPKEKYLETSQESSQQYSSDIVKNQLKDMYEDSSDELSVELNHKTTVQKSSKKPSEISANEPSTHRSTADSFEVSQQPHHHINHEMHHTVSPVLDLNASQEPGQTSDRRNNVEFYPGIGKGAPKLAPGQGVLADPAIPAPVVVSGIEELFILPKASRPMREHWDIFYKSVSAAARRHLSLHLSTIIFFQILLLIFES